jgi:hypothetical protein
MQDNTQAGIRAPCTGLLHAAAQAGTRWRDTLCYCCASQVVQKPAALTATATAWLDLSHRGMCKNVDHGTAAVQLQRCLDHAYPTAPLAVIFYYWNIAAPSTKVWAVRCEPTDDPKQSDTTAAAHIWAPTSPAADAGQLPFQQTLSAASCDTDRATG